MPPGPILLTAPFSYYRISCSATHLQNKMVSNVPNCLSRRVWAILRNNRHSPRPSGMVSQTHPLDCYHGSTRSLSIGRIIIPGTTMKASSRSFSPITKDWPFNKSLPGYRYIGFLEQVLQLQCVSIMKHIKRVHPKCMNLPQFRWDTRIFRKRFFAYQWGTYYALIQIFYSFYSNC